MAGKQIDSGIKVLLMLLKDSKCDYFKASFYYLTGRNSLTLTTTYLRDARNHKTVY